MPKVKVNGAEIFYTDDGPHDAPVIVFSPLLYMNTSIYKPFVEAFSDEYRVICYDHRGQGASTHSTKRSELQTTIKDAITVIEQLHFEPCHFFGNCLGAFVGLNLAVQRSDLLKSCTLIGANAEASSAKEVKEMDAYLEKTKKEGAKFGMANFANMMFGPSFRASKDPMVVERREKIMQQLMSLSSDELENARQLFHHQSISKEDLKKIAVPVLIIAGDEDQPNNIAAYKRLGQMIPHVNYKTIHHAGYAAAIEQPQQVINLLRDHIEKSERAYTAAQSVRSKASGKAARPRS